MSTSTLDYQKIQNSLSSVRLSTFEQATKALPEALELYQWNMQISAAFLPCLQVCEVVIRNSVSYVLTLRHGNRWAWERGFIGTLPNPTKGYNQRHALAKATQGTTDINNVIPELNFAFWQMMFTSRHDTQLWLPYLSQIFPNAPITNVSQFRNEIYKELEIIRSLRNRIAHHEPIFKRNLQQDYERIIKIIQYQSVDTANWLSQSQMVTSLLANKP